MNEGSEIAFNLVYLLLLFGLIYPPQEFCSAGKVNNCDNENLLRHQFFFRIYDRKFIFELFGLGIDSVRAISHQQVMFINAGSLRAATYLLSNQLPVL